MSDIYRYLDTVGDGTGNKNATGDYSSSAEEFLIAPGPTEYYKIERLVVKILDTGAFDAGAYGNAITLTNGIYVQKKDASGSLLDLCDGIPVLTNAAWGRMCYDVQTLSFGLGDDSLVVRWTFSKNGAPLTLDGKKGEYLAVVLNDDFTGLNEHYFFVGGQSGPFKDSVRNIGGY